MIAVLRPIKRGAIKEGMKVVRIEDVSYPTRLNSAGKIT